MISKNKIKEVVLEILIELKDKRKDVDVDTTLEFLLSNEDMIFMNKLLEKLNIN